MTSVGTGTYAGSSCHADPDRSAGLRVLEIAAIGPVPFAGMLLADLGADVVRVDRRGRIRRAPWTDPRLDVLGRGRRSVAVDLKSERGVEVVLRLAEERRRAARRLPPRRDRAARPRARRLAARNPRLVYGRMTGWGQDGPLAHAAGHDINYIALTGALHAIGRAGEPPVPPLNLVGDFGGGALLLAFGVLAALLERAALGQGPGRRRRDGRRRGAR